MTNTNSLPAPSAADRLAGQWVDRHFDGTNPNPAHLCGDCRFQAHLAFSSEA